MFTERKARMLRQECVIIVRDRALDFSELCFLLIADQKFRRRDPSQVVEQRATFGKLRQAELAGR